MPITKVWTTPVPARQDPAAPITTGWGNDIWDNAQFLMEWLGNDYLAQAAQNHNHDGVNSAKVNIFPGLIPNGSFEEISGGLPISWTVTQYSGGTVASSAAVNAHGERVLAISSTVLANGGGEATHDEYKPVAASRYYGAEIFRWATVAGVSCKVDLIWYAADKSQISITPLINDTSTPTAATLYSNPVLSPTNARFVRTRVTGGVPGVGSAVGTVYFDGGILLEPLADNSVRQNNILAGAVGQTQLKTATGSGVTTGTTGSSVTLPGGQYGFYPQLDSSLSVGAAYWGYNVTSDIARETAVVLGTTQTAKMTLASSSSSLTAYAHQRYIQSSPPYDLGDGEIPLFIFLEIERATGKIISGYEAPEAPWHNNGPTNIMADHYDEHGQGYYRRKDMAHVPFTLKEAQADIGKLKEYAAAFDAANEIMVPITQAIKQADMPLIPRPMEPAEDGSTVVVMLDPVAALGLELFEMKQHDEVKILDHFINGHITVDNTPLNRAGPPGVEVVGFKWK